MAIRAAPAGLLKLLDSSLLEVFVVAKSVHEDAALNVAKYGAVVKLADGSPFRSPFVGIMNQQAAVMLRAAEPMGFSPTSRSRVSISGPKKSKNVFAGLKRLDVDGA